MRSALAALALVGLALGGQLTACATNPAERINSGVRGVLDDVSQLLSGTDLPSKHLETINAINDPTTWRFRPGADAPLERTREAVRLLGEADYATWADTGVVVSVLSSMGLDHPSALVRADAIDTMGRMAPWLLDADDQPEHSPTEADVIEALKVIRDATGKDDTDPALTAAVLVAVRDIAAYAFGGTAGPEPGASLSSTARGHRSALRMARSVLTSFTQRALDGFRGDPEINDALDRSYVHLSASSVRLSLLAAATGDRSPTTRAAAVRQLGGLGLDPNGATLALSVGTDRNSSVRREAAIALGGLPAEMAVPPLLDALHDDMSDVRGAASRSLSRVSGESFSDDRAAWLRWWDEHQASKPSQPESGPSESGPSDSEQPESK